MFPLVYEINSRVWIRQLSEHFQRPVTLATVPDSEFAFFRRSGFDYVWLMGVWRTSVYSEAIARSHQGLRTTFLELSDYVDPHDIVASPYAIADYRLNPFLGEEEELEVFRQRLQNEGIRLMLDFVPNHMAIDNRWLPDHPEFFVTVSAEEQSVDPESSFEYRHNHFLAHGRDPYFPAWTDTLQLNYAHYGTHDMMTENLVSISRQCDAVRCDVAMLELKSVFDTTWGSLCGSMPEEFWPKAISAVKAEYPDFIFLAESYWNKEWELQQHGFDFTYDKPFYDYLTGHPVQMAKLRGHLEGEWGYQSRLCRFIENHDEARAARKLGPNHLAGALVMLSAPGMHLVHQGQLEGYRSKLPVQLLRQPSEPFNSEQPEIYHRMFTLTAHELFRTGGLETLDVVAPETLQCLGFRRFTDEGAAFVLANFSSTGIEFSFRHEELPEGEFDVFSTHHASKTVVIEREDGMVRIKLSPHEAVVLGHGKFAEN